MSRFYLVGAHEAAESGGQRERLSAGTTIADTKINSIAGDIICPVLCSKPTKFMIPLDSAAVTAMIAQGFTDAQVGKALCGVPTGADSIR